MPDLVSCSLSQSSLPSLILLYLSNDVVYSRDLKPVSWTPSVTEPAVSHPTPQPFSHHDHDHHDLPSDFEDVPSSASSSSSPFTLHTLRLVQRPQHTTLALPRSSTWPSSAVPQHEAPFHFLPDVTTYARFMLASPAYLIGELERDVRELDLERRMQKSAGEDGVGLGFIDAAKAKVVEQIDRAKRELLTPGVERKMKEVRDVSDSLIARAARDRDRARETLERAQKQAPEEPDQPISSGVFPAESDGPAALTLVPHELLASLGHSWTRPTRPNPPPASVSPSTSPVNPSPLNPASVAARAAKARAKQHLASPPDPSFFFYQSFSGHHLYLHPLDIRVLLHEFKAYASFPEVIQVRVEAAEEGTSKSKYLLRADAASSASS